MPYIIFNVIMKPKNILLPKAARYLAELGENIRLARLRRRLRAELVAQRAGISRPTLVSIEKGKPSVSIGAYVQVLLVLGMVEDILLVARDDVLGRKLQDAQLSSRARAPKQKA